MTRKYAATGIEAEHEPGSRGRVLRNLLGIGAGKRAYIGGIHAAIGRNYAPLAALFAVVIERTRRRAASSRTR